MSHKGTLSSQSIRELIKKGCVQATAEIPESSIQPASLDLRVAAGEIIRLPGMFLPSTDDVLSEAKDLAQKSNLDYWIPIKNKGFMLEVGIPYLIPIEESLDLPKNICARANNKSSSGRINLQIRLLCNKNREFDSVPYGYKGKIYIVAIAKSFPVHIMPGETFNQIRFYDCDVTDARLDKKELEEVHEKDGLVFDLDGYKIPWNNVGLIHSSVVLTANLESEIVAYRFKGVATDGLSYKDRNVDASRFFEPIYRPIGDDHIVLSKGGFYILSTLEAFRVPAEYCSEMVAYNTGIGEYRSHFAGFFDPGWGCGNEMNGRAAVLEILPHEDIMLKHGQPVCLMEVYHMDKTPEFSYGSNGNHYFEQTGPKLGKQFAYTHK